MIHLGIDELQVTLSDFVVTITLNRPQKLNSVTQEMSNALVEVAGWVNESAEVRSVVIIGHR